MGCCEKCRHVGPILSALLTRLVFSFHVLVAFWRITVMVEWQYWYFFLLTGLLGLFIETIVTLVVRQGREYKWFCPSVFFYLLSIVPCVWILELHMLGERVEARDKAAGKIQELVNITQTDSDGEFPDIPGLDLSKLPIPEMPETQWVVMVEQMLLFLLIIGRWMLPKGDISRNELSQLLLVYIGMAADIIEFFEAFKEEKVKYNWTLIMIILAFWSASLLQFTMVLTASASVKTRPGFSSGSTEEEVDNGCCKCTFDTEIFGIMTAMLLQDGPFLTLRLLLLARYEVRSYMHIFFTVKNSLVLLLMVYRLFVVFENAKDEETESPGKDRDKRDYIQLQEEGDSPEDSSPSRTDQPATKGTDSDK